MALCKQNFETVLPTDLSAEFPGYACLLGNILETAGVAFAQPDCSHEMVRAVAVSKGISVVSFFFYKVVPAPT